MSENDNKTATETKFNINATEWKANATEWKPNKPSVEPALSQLNSNSASFVPN